MPAGYMFRNVPKVGEAELAAHGDDYVAYTLAQMDKHGITKAMIGVDEIGGAHPHPANVAALSNHPDRFFASTSANPNLGEAEVARIRRVAATHGLKCVTAFPCGLYPQVPINSPLWHPIFALCIELDIPFACCVGVPGPRVPLAPQKVELVDEVCWAFPTLKFVMRHGAEPWTALAIKLMLKYPNLSYMTSAFAPKHYPADILAYANSRGADRIMYAGYFPMGLSLDRIFSELPAVPLKAKVWPKFLRENATRIFQLEP
jgi:predicted TIM-barrel fold metal-dependent hydrolase